MLFRSGNGSQQYQTGYAAVEKAQPSLRLTNEQVTQLLSLAQQAKNKGTTDEATTSSAPNNFAGTSTGKGTTEKEYTLDEILDQDWTD